MLLIAALQRNTQALDRGAHQERVAELRAGNFLVLQPVQKTRCVHFDTRSQSVGLLLYSAAHWSQ
jgi:hypothetical protein